MSNPQWSDTPFPKEGSIEYELNCSGKAQYLRQINSLLAMIGRYFFGHPDINKLLNLKLELENINRNDWQTIKAKCDPILSTWDNYYDSFICEYHIENYRNGNMNFSYSFLNILEKKELQQICYQYQLDTTGTRIDLINRILDLEEELDWGDRVDK